MSVKKKKTPKAKRKPGKFRKGTVLVLDTKNGTGEVADVTFPAAMKQTGKSMGFLYRCINDGRLPAFKVARATVFRQSDIDKLMTPVPYTPVNERGYSKHRKAKETAPKAPSTKSSSKSSRGADGGGSGGNSKPSKKLKASVAKALSKMTASEPESDAPGN